MKECYMKDKNTNKVKLDPQELMIKEFLSGTGPKLIAEDCMNKIADGIEKTNKLPSDFDIMVAIKDSLVKHEFDLGDVDVENYDRTTLECIPDDNLLQFIAMILQSYATITMIKGKVIDEISKSKIKEKIV